MKQIKMCAFYAQEIHFIVEIETYLVQSWNPQYQKREKRKKTKFAKLVPHLCRHSRCQVVYNEQAKAKCHKRDGVEDPQATKWAKTMLLLKI